MPTRRTGADHDASDGTAEASLLDVIRVPGGWPYGSRLDVGFVIAVTAAYLAATALAIASLHGAPDRLMTLAERIVQGRLDDPSFAGTVDSVAIDGRFYLAVGPLQALVYLPFVPVPALHGVARYIVSLVPGLAAGLLALPLVRAYGARDASAYWVAMFAALGTLLWYVSVFGDLYYLAHAQSFLALELFLLEWAGRRRAVVLGGLLAVSFLARPTTILAAVPFALALLWRRSSWLSAGIAFGAPIATAIAILGLYNFARFGSALDSGYGVSLLQNPSLISRRTLGVLSIAQVPENLRLALLSLPGLHRTFPYLLPSPYGMSMVLVSPGLLVAVRAGITALNARLIWIASGLVALPVLVYYGGGYIQYGFRYSLDFTPFLIALVAIGTAKRFGRLERLLFVASVASVAFGILWHARIIR